MSAVAIQHRETIINRVHDGEYAAEIARDFGISPAALSNQLASDPEYHKARECGIEHRLAQRESELENTADSAGVSRARELLSHQRWRAEREFPQRWGAKSSIEHSGPGGGPIPVCVTVAFIAPQVGQAQGRTLDAAQQSAIPLSPKTK
jgi:hypothetical protein